MKKKSRKKWLKKRNLYVNPKETWDLCIIIAEFILPRLKKFKALNNGYPFGITPEEWDEILDKMILAFQQIIDDEYAKPLFFGVEEMPNFEELKEEGIKRNAIVSEGLSLFAMYFEELWW